MNDRLPEARGGIDTDPAAAAAPLGWSLHSDDPAAALRRQGFVLLDAAALAQMAQAAPAPLTAAWDDLPPDAHLRDGGAYRFRRHASYTLDLPAELRTKVAFQYQEGVCNSYKQLAEATAISVRFDVDGNAISAAHGRLAHQIHSAAAAQTRHSTTARPGAGIGDCNRNSCINRGSCSCATFVLFLYGPRFPC